MISMLRKEVCSGNIREQNIYAHNKGEKVSS